MGFIRSLVRGEALTPSPAAPPAPRFATSLDSGTLYGVQSLDEAIRILGAGGPVSRREAIAVPAVKRGRDIVAGGLGQLPLGMHDPAGKPTEWSLFTQPEADKAPPITWTGVVDDLIFFGRAWLRVTHFGWHGKPAEVVRLDPASVTVQPGMRVHKVRTGSGTSVEWVPDEHLIRIDSPNDPLLQAGARAIRVLSRLEVAALNSADGLPPVDYFRPADANVDPFTDDPADDPEGLTSEEKAVEFLDQWAAARRARATALMPTTLEYEVNGFSPKDLQLVEAREMAITEVARCIGVDSEDLGISTTSRSYFNAQDRRRHRLDFTLGPYRRAIEARLSMPDVTPRGFTVRFDGSEFARADDKETAETDKVLIDSGVMTRDEIRARRGLSPLGPTTPAPTPEPAREEANA